MILALQIIAIFVIGFSIIVGMISGSFLVFLGCFIGGILSGFLYIALAKVLDNQDRILDFLNDQDEKQRREQRQVKKECTNCKFSYDSDYSSCPNCGYREGE